MWDNQGVYENMRRMRNRPIRVAIPARRPKRRKSIAYNIHVLRHSDPDVLSRRGKASFAAHSCGLSGRSCRVAIEDGSVLAGALPPKTRKLVVAWIEIHQEDLMADWELAVNGHNPLPIRGLDQ